MAMCSVCDVRLAVLFLVLSCISLASSAPYPESPSSRKPLRLANTCVRIHSGVSNEDDLIPVIMLHGIMDSRETWRGLYQVIATETHRKVCILDARNHGDSPWTNVFNFDILAEDVDYFMEEKNISKAIFVGHSMGGITAMKLALSKPEKVKKIFIEDISPRGVTIDQMQNIAIFFQLLKASLSAIPEGADLPTAKRAVRDFIKAMLPGEYIEFQTDQEVDSIPLKFENGVYKWKTNIDGIVAGANSGEPLLKPFSGVYNGDALFIYGKKSSFKVGEDKDLILKHFPKAQLVGIEGAGHSIHHIFPEYLKELLKFIKSD